MERYQLFLSFLVERGGNGRRIQIHWLAAVIAILLILDILFN